MTVARGRQHRQARAQLLAGATHCYWCGTPISDDLPVGHPRKATADHLIAVADGGIDTIDNMVPACGRCNSRRGRRDPSVLRTTLVYDW